jgi:hypothetical protein
MRAFAPGPLLPGVLSLCLLFAGCSLDRSGLGPAETDDFAVEPNLVCQGETVRLSWSLVRIPAAPENCASPNGGYDSRLSCTASSDCPDGGGCIDGLCVRPGISPREVDFGSGCRVDTGMTVFATPARPVARPVEADPRIAGSETVEVTQDTTYTAIASVASGGIRPPIERRVEVVEEEITTPKTVIFPEPRCQGGFVPSTVDIERLRPDPIVGSERVEIVRVVNRSGFAVTVTASDPDRGPVELGAGEVTEALNGPARGFWSATPLFTPSPLPTDCFLSGSELPPPPVLDLELQCVRPLEEG